MRRRTIAIVLLVASAALTLSIVIASWREVFTWWNSISKTALFSLVAFGIFATGIGLWATSPRPSSLNQTPGFRILPWWSIVIGLLVSAVATWSAIALLRSAANGNAALEFDAIKTGLTVGAGVGGLAVLLLAARKQWLNELIHRHSEKVANHSQHDADERRVTELYIKAVEQLGEEKAVVRLGGLYGLERLAQNHLQHRQTIVNVICTYLRMPYNADDTQPVQEKSDTNSSASGPQSQGEEREVRLAAQTILRNHLLDNENTSPEQFWGDVSIDLKGAQLEKFSLQNCSVGDLDLSDASFIGPATFSGTHFRGELKLTRAIFADSVDFSGARLERPVQSSDVKFMGLLSFYDAQIAGANFERTEFHEGADFHATTFDGPVTFKEVAATGPCSFGDAKFMDEALFESAAFHKGAGFNDVEFAENAKFDNSHFDHMAFFTQAKFDGYTTFRGVSFAGGLWCEDVAFMSNTRFGGAVLAKQSRIENVTFHQHAHFDYVKLEGILVIVDTTFRSYLQMHDWTEGPEGLVSFFDTYVLLADNKPPSQKPWLPKWHVVPCEDRPGWGRFISRTNDRDMMPNKPPE